MATIDVRGATVSAADPPISTNPNPDLAIKAPVRLATTGSNITLSGLQTIDGVALAAGDRVLVKDQTDATTNGLYNVSTGNWTRTIDAANNSQWATGTLVDVTAGTLNARTVWSLAAANPIVLGTSALAFTGVAPFGVFTQAGAGAVPGTAVAKLLQTAITPEDFGAVGDGSTDDLGPLTNFFNALLASPHCEGRMLSRTYGCSGALPNVNVSGFTLRGFGMSGFHNVVTNDVGSVIKAIAGNTGTMLTIAPTEGASAQYLTGIRLIGVTFDCNSIAAKGLVTKSMRYGDFDVAVLNALTTGWEMGCSTTLGDPPDTQYNRIRYLGDQQFASAGVAMHITGTSIADVSLNWFEFIDLVQSNATALIVDVADSNLWGVVRVFMIGGGTATNSIEWRGGATGGATCRSELYMKLSATQPAIAKGTGTYTVGATNIKILDIDKGNNTPDPTVETGASVYWQNDNTPLYDGVWRAYTPTVTAGAGAFTTVSATGRYMRQANIVYVQIVVTITINGSASSFVSASLPVVAGASGFGELQGHENAVTGKEVRGFIPSGGSICAMQFYDGSYPGGDGRQILIAGLYEG